MASAAAVEGGGGQPGYRCVREAGLRVEFDHIAEPRCRELIYVMLRPPSTTIVCPVTYPPAADASQTAVAASGP